jgi:thymidylate kinase
MKDKKCTIIAIEGAHGVGKTTIIEALKEKIKETTDKRIYTFDELYGHALFKNRSWRGDIFKSEIQWYIATYSRNLYIFKRHIKEDCIILLDRNYISIFAYAATQLEPEIYRNFYLAVPKPERIVDKVIILTCYPREAIKRIIERDKPGDRENKLFDGSYFKKVQDNLVRLANSYGFDIVNTNKEGYMDEIVKLVGEVIDK